MKRLFLRVNISAKKHFIIRRRLHTMLMEQRINHDTLQQTEPDRDKLPVLAEIEIEPAIIVPPVYNLVVVIFVKPHTARRSAIRQQNKPVHDRIKWAGFIPMDRSICFHTSLFTQRSRSPHLKEGKM